MPAIDRIQVDQLRKGDRVRAVASGPVGVVIDPDRAGWAIVQYPVRHRNRHPGAGVIAYEHGKNSVHLVSAR